jgi:hypothetical protein
MAEIEDHIDYIMSQHGKPLTTAPMPPATMQSMQGRVPGLLSAIWKRFGQCNWFGGGFQIVDPLRYAPLISAAFAGDPDLDAGVTHVFALGPFGQIEAWNETHGSLTLMTLPNQVLCGGLSGRPRYDPEDTMGTILAMADDRAADREDAATGKKMFSPLKKKHGTLPQDHIFAPVLHPALGGVQTARNFRPAPALEAISLMHQAEPFWLLDTSSPAMAKVRWIGRGA